MDRPVFMISSVFILGFVAWGALGGDSLSRVCQGILDYLTTQWGWLYLAGVLFFVVFCLYLALGKYGGVKLGKPTDVPEYSTGSWFAMLFVCGMGVGLFFWSVAEPILHYAGGPAYAGEPGSTQAMEWAMPISFFHWGISAWAVFVVIGLIMGIVLFQKGMPALMSSCFYPLLGERVNGPIGKAINIITLLTSIFGMSTTIGLGTMQIGAGISHTFGVSETNGLYLIILVVSILVCLATSCLPIGKGIKKISNVSMGAFIFLLVFVFCLGPIKFIMDNFFSSVGIYVQNFLYMSLWSDPVEQSGWLGSWTIFYWAWWISWAPFVGMFIAKISKGRTIREFVLGALIAPTLFDMVVFGILGSTSLHIETGSSTAGIMSAAVGENVARSIYVLLEQFPLSAVTAVIALFVIFNFFTVSAESCIIVLAGLSSGGSAEPGARLKIFWGIVMGASAGVLMLMGGLEALQMASIVGAFPFLLLMLLISVSLVKVVRASYRSMRVQGEPVRAAPCMAQQEKGDAGQSQ